MLSWIQYSMWGNKFGYCFFCILCYDKGWLKRMFFWFFIHLSFSIFLLQREKFYFWYLFLNLRVKSLVLVKISLSFFIHLLLNHISSFTHDLLDWDLSSNIPNYRVRSLVFYFLDHSGSTWPISPFWNSCI